MKISTHLKRQLRSLVLAKLKKEEEQTAVITTSYAVSQSMIEAFIKAFPILTGKTIENVVDKNILGGFIIKSGSTYIDGSIEGSITRFMSQIYERH